MKKQTLAYIHEIYITATKNATPKTNIKRAPTGGRGPLDNQLISTFYLNPFNAILRFKIRTATYQV
jgi:hypothetical protein